MQCTPNADLAAGGSLSAFIPCHAMPPALGSLQLLNNHAMRFSFRHSLASQPAYVTIHYCAVLPSKSLYCTAELGIRITLHVHPQRMQPAHNPWQQAERHLFAVA